MLLICANSIAQYAGYIALKNEDEEIQNMIKEFENRSKIVFDIINNSNTLTMIKPSGAFYGFINIEYLIGKKYNDVIINDASDLANILLDDFHVAVLPGIAFGNNKFIRISYATDEETIKNALDSLIILTNLVK